ncbi:MAG: nucleoside recognition protein [Bacteroidaceae bacterium]|nr:nucleoside recognition protein [Bacteroidaceae bacterium]
MILSGTLHRVATVMRTAVRPALRTSAWLLRLMLPISLAVCLMQHYGVIEFMARWLDPLFRYIGLPGASAIAFLTGAFSTTYAGLAVMLSMVLTLRQATILAVMILICHALPMESAVVRKVGSEPLRMASIRVLGAFLAAAYLNVVLPDMNAVFGGTATSAASLPLADDLRLWLAGSLRLTLMICLLIYALMAVQRLLDEFSIMRLLTSPIRPLMKFFGLPQNTAYLWLVGNILGISYGSAAMIELEESGQITRSEANDVNYHLIMNHSMLEDTMVFAMAGISAFWILSTRILFAFALVWLRRGVKETQKNLHLKFGM